MSSHSFSRSNPGCRVLRALFVLGALVIASAAGAATCLVTSDGTGNGSDWGQAMTLQAALTSGGGCDEIWVKAGTYTPGVTREDSFQILPGVAVYGGFAGDELVRTTRNVATHLTILSGDIGVAGDNTDNSYHVVFMDGTQGTKITATTVLDGFTIRDGNADGSGSQNSGGGLYCDGSGDTSHECSPSLRNLVFSDNSAGFGGGAVANYGINGGTSSPSLSNVIFRDNSAGVFGGAIFNYGANSGTSSPNLVDVTFSGNSADNGGGAMCNFVSGGNDIGVSSPNLTNVTFNDNSAGFGGGALYNYADAGVSSPSLINVTFSSNSAVSVGGAIYNDAYFSGTSSPNLTNVTFSGNNAQYGGAMYNYGYPDGSTSSPNLSNVILWADSASLNGPEVVNESNAEPHYDHSVIEGSRDSNGDWDTSLGVDDGNNLDTDPYLGALADNGGATQTLLLGAGSSAIDAGNGSTCPITDQRGVSRPQGPQCDIGAVEALPNLVFANGFELIPPI